MKPALGWRARVIQFGDAFFLLAMGLWVHSVNTGGFRFHIGPLEISTRRASNLLIESLLIIFLRHVLVPNPNIVARLHRLIVWIAGGSSSDKDDWEANQPAFLRPDWRFVAVLVLVTRLLVLSSGYLGSRFAQPFGNATPDATVAFANSVTLKTLQARWDAGWYAQIATDGYRWNAETPTVQQNVAFFPAFPLAIRGVLRMSDLIGSAVGREPPSGKDREYQAINIGAIIAIVAFSLGLLFMLRLAKLDLDPVSARWSIVLAATYPFAYFYSASYTEALLFAAITGAFLFERQTRFAAMIACGLVIGLTKQTGFLVSIPLLAGLVFRLRNQRRAPRPIEVLASCSPAVGAGIYCLYLLSWFGDPLAWVRAQAAWAPAHRWQLIFSSTNILNYVADHRYEAINLAAVFLVIPWVWKSRRIRPSYLLLGLVALAVPLILDVFPLGRMTAPIFSTYLAMAVAISRRSVFYVVAGSLLILQMIAAAFFYGFRPLY